MRTPASAFLLLVASSCANPISNLPFYEDAELVAALPSEARFEVPSNIRLARVGTSTALADAVAASADLQSVVETLFRSGEVLRAAEPDVRTDVGREWDGVQAAGDLGGDRFTWWVRGSVVRVTEGGDATWTIEAASDQGGTYRPIGQGRHDPGGYGDGSWDLEAMVQVLIEGQDIESDPVGVLSFDYEDQLEDSGVRSVTLEHTRGAEVLDTWTVVGSIALAWFAPSTLTEPALPGVFQVFHDDNGGWAIGEIYDADEALSVLTCWSPVGDTVYAEGTLFDEGHGAVTAAMGVEDDCSTPNPF